MKYEKAEAEVIEFEEEDIVTDSTCAQPQYDAEYCDGVSQAVTKPF